jgi:hypothetical protein
MVRPLVPVDFNLRHYNLAVRSCGVAIGQYVRMRFGLVASVAFGGLTAPIGLRLRASGRWLAAPMGFACPHAEEEA